MAGVITSSAPQFATDRRARFEGVELAYGRRGEQGSPVLMIQGFGMPGRAWAHQLPALAERHQVAWYDHRGAGNTRAAPGRYTMALLADDARRLLDHLGWQRAHVVGVSMGGMVSQELALGQRQRLLSLTLIATHGGGRRARLPTGAGALRFLQANVARPRQRIAALERLLFPPAYLARCDRRRLRAVLAADFSHPLPPRYRVSQLAAVASHDTRRRLAALAGLPVLVVKPALDLLVRPAENDRLAQRIPGARLVTFPDAGHGLIRQCAAELNALLLEHFASAEHSGRGQS